MVGLHATSNMNRIRFKYIFITIFFCFFNQVRTTNDVEGWHIHMAKHAGLKTCATGLNLYILFEVLYEEAVQVKPSKLFRLLKLYALSLYDYIFSCRYVNSHVVAGAHFKEREENL